MAENSTPEERTEMPTDRRLSELRKQGALHNSGDVTVVLTLITGFLLLHIVWQYLLADMLTIMRGAFLLSGEGKLLTIADLQRGLQGLVFLLAPELGILLLAVAVVASISVMVQTNWAVKEKKIDFKFSKLNPITGMKRVFSIISLVQTLKAVLKLAIILPVGYFTLKAYTQQFVNLMYFSIPTVFEFIGTSIHAVFWKIIGILIGFAIFDYVWGKHQWLKENKMTKQEVKEERKTVEGDEQTKRKIIAKGLERATQRIMKAVPRADVVITNPTHYAVALKYDREKQGAPRVVAKGRGDIALRIREIATEHKIPIVERKPLARALYANAKVGSEIPYELYRAVAEVYAYVFRLRGRRPTEAVQKQRGAN
jgi:flagellar biosynthesis protein FlhB